MKNKTFFSYLFGVGIYTFFVLSAQAEKMIESSKAAFYVGQDRMVCGAVHEIKTFSKGTYISVGGKYPYQHITFLVWDKDVNKFNERFGSLSVFMGSNACARGAIESYKNTLQIKVSNPTFLRLIKS